MDVVNNVLALAVGLLTGLYFERRATKSARRDADAAEARNRELRETLTNLRAELVSRHPAPSAVRRMVPSRIGDLTAEALAFAREHQDASGRLRSTTLRNGMVAQGFAVAEVDAAIQALVDRNAMRRDGTEWEVQA